MSTTPTSSTSSRQRSEEVRLLATDTPTAAPAVSEKGYVLDVLDEGSFTGYASWDRFEKVPELLWPNSIGVYMRMSAEDGRIASVLEAITLPIRRTAWRIDPNGARDEVVEFVAQCLGLPIVGADESIPTGRTRDRFSWGAHLQQALSMLEFGHAFFEQVYRVDDRGRYALRKLAPRPQETISTVKVARDGGLIGIEQYPPGITGVQSTSEGATIPVDRLVAYVRNPRPGQWLGRSLLRPAYKHWLLKDELIRIEAATARRNGMGVPVATSTEQERGDDKAIQKYADMASSFRGGKNAGVGLPHGADLKLLGVSGNLPNLRQAIEYHDKQMALAGLAHFLNLDKGGSYSLASVLNDTFVQSTQTTGESVRDTTQAHVIEDLVDVNWGPDEPVPLLTFDEIGSRQDATAAALQLLVASGVLTPDSTLEAFERQQLGLPAADEDTAREVATPSAPTNDTAPAASTPRRARGRRLTIETDGALTLW